MKNSSTYRSKLNSAQLEEMMLDEIRKQNWLRITISKVLNEEFLLSIQ